MALALAAGLVKLPADPGKEYDCQQDESKNDECPRSDRQLQCHGLRVFFGSCTFSFVYNTIGFTGPDNPHDDERGTRCEAGARRRAPVVRWRRNIATRQGRHHFPGQPGKSRKNHERNGCEHQETESREDVTVPIVY